MIIQRPAKLQRRVAGDSSEFSKNPTDPDLEHIPVSMVKNSLMIEEVKLPLYSGMDRIVMVEVKGRPRRKSL